MNDRYWHCAKGMESCNECAEWLEEMKISLHQKTKRSSYKSCALGSTCKECSVVMKPKRASLHQVKSAIVGYIEKFR